LLEKAPQLEPQTLLLHLELTFPGQEWYRSKRTLQRRVEQWRVLHGPAREVMFLQHHQPGVLGISDFTLLKGEPITVAGQALEHRLFHFRLLYSGWCHVEVIHAGESFVALAEALQNALALCSGVPGCRTRRLQIQYTATLLRSNARLTVIVVAVGERERNAGYRQAA
jgi:hypothetical protein